MTVSGNWDERNMPMDRRKFLKTTGLALSTDVLGGQALVPPGHVVFHGLPVLEGAEPVALNATEMDEDVFSVLT